MNILLLLSLTFASEILDGYIVGHECDEFWDCKKKVIQADKKCQMDFIQACTYRGSLVRVEMGFRNCKSIAAESNWMDREANCKNATLDGRAVNITGYSMAKKASGFMLQTVKGTEYKFGITIEGNEQ